MTHTGFKPATPDPGGIQTFNLPLCGNFRSLTGNFIVCTKKFSFELAAAGLKNKSFWEVFYMILVILNVFATFSYDLVEKFHF